jgi:hypothetical protein
MLLTLQNGHRNLSAFNQNHSWRIGMAKAAKKTSKKGIREEWSKAHLAELKKHSKAKTRVDAIAKAMGRTEGALRQKAYALELPLGHRR